MKSLSTTILWYIVFSVSTLVLAQSAYAGHCGGSHDKMEMAGDKVEKAASDGTNDKDTRLEREESSTGEREELSSEKRGENGRA
jgi:hypothetical protein